MTNKTIARNVKAADIRTHRAAMGPVTNGPVNKIIKAYAEQMHGNPPKPTVFDYLNRSELIEGSVECVTGDSESWFKTILLDARWLESDDDYLRHYFGADHYYGGAGRSYRRNGHVQRSKHGVLITVSGGLDI